MECKYYTDKTTCNVSNKILVSLPKLGNHMLD